MRKLDEKINGTMEAADVEENANAVGQGWIG